MGTVEDIRKEYDFTGNTHVYTNTFHIRSSNGKLHKIVTDFTTAAGADIEMSRAEAA